MKTPFRHADTPPSAGLSAVPRSLLFSELLWFMRLRWAAGAAVVALGAAAIAADGPGATAGAAVAIGAAILLYNTAAAVAARRLPGLGAAGPRLLRFAAAQIYLDVLALTALAMLTGGLGSPLMGFFVIHMVFAGLLQPMRWAFASAAFAICAFVAALAATSGLPAEAPAVLALAGWVATLLITVYLTDRIARALYLREQARLRQNHRLRALAAKLRDQQAAMVQHEKLAAMGRLAAGVAHEINNPLSNMDSVLQLMQRSGGGGSPERLEALREQIRRIHGTVGQLTTLAHPDKGRVEAISANDLVRSALELVAFDHRLRRIRVEEDFHEPSPRLLASRQSLQQVLMNLLLNAVDALEVVEDPRIELSTSLEGDACLIGVADNGPGIPQGDLQRIFEPFFTTKPVGKGTGLGLSISHSLVREHRGEIVAANRGGAVFTVRLPALGQPGGRRADAEVAAGAAP